MSPDEYHADAPLEHYSDDRLGYSPFASRIANTVQNLSSARGSTIALYGPWGTGKTTLMNFVRSYLNDLPPADQPVVVTFNPWLFSGETGLVARFFETIITSLRRSPYPEDLSNSLASVASILSEIPGPFNWVAKAAGHIVSKHEAPSLEQRLQVLSKKLKEQKRKLLVIMDDLDRLLPNELATVCMLIKLLSDLPNTIFLVAMDQDEAAEALSRRAERYQSTGNKEVEKGYGFEYLQKIIQISFEVPKPDQYATRALFLDAINEILGDESSSLDENYFKGIFLHGLESLIDTPRKITRFRNTARATFAAVKGEVNTCDFLAIEGLRMYCPHIYYLMRENPAYFCGDTKFSGALSASEQEVKDFHARWVNEFSTEYLSAALVILKQLFPRVFKAIDNRAFNFDGSYPKPDVLLARHEPSYPVYFSYTVPGRKISNTEMQTLISADSKVLEAGLKRLSGQLQTKESTTTRLLAFLERLEDYMPVLSEEQASTLIAVFVQIGDELIVPGDFGKGFLQLPRGNEHLILSLIDQLLGKLGNSQSRFTALQTAFTSPSLYIGMFLLNHLDRIRRSERDAFGRRVSLPIVAAPREDFGTESQFQSLIGAQLNRASSASKQEFLNCHNPTRFLAYWTDLDPQSLRTFSDQHFKSVEEKLGILKLFIENAPDPKTIEALFGIEDLAAQLDVCEVKWNAEQKQAIEYLEKCQGKQVTDQPSKTFEAEDGED